MTQAEMPVPVRVYRFVGWEIRPFQRLLLVDGKRAQPGGRAFDVLLVLAECSGRMVSKGELLKRVWGREDAVEENNLSVHIAALRKLLGPNAIATKMSRGYQLTAVPLDDASEPAPVAAPSSPALAVESSQLSGRARITNLPSVAPVLFGREREIERVLGLLAKHSQVSIVGAGGIGKTCLALSVAHLLRQQYADGCWIVRFAIVLEPEQMVPAIAHALEVALPIRELSLEESIRLLAELLSQCSMLLVLDNCEQIKGAVARFANAVAQSAPEVRLLVTSQAVLNSNLERQFRLAPLEIPVADDFVSARASSAVALLADRVASQQDDFVFGEHNAGDLAEICRRLDGLPLALELAAGRVPLFGLQGVRRRLGDRLQLLAGGARATMQRHEGLQDTMAWSYSLLTPDEQRVFRCAGVFAGSFGLHLAERTLGTEGQRDWAVMDRLRGIVDKSLIVLEPGEPRRYRMLETAREFALRELAAADEAGQACRRHASAVASVFEDSVRDQWNHTSQARVARFHVDLDNARAALEWSAANDKSLHVRLAASTAWLWRMIGQRLEGLRHCRAASPCLDSGPLPAQALLLLEWAELAHHDRDPENLPRARRAVELARRCDDPALLYRALGRLAITTSVVSDDEAAAMDAFREMGRYHDPAWPEAASWHELNAEDFVLNMIGDQEGAESVALAEQRTADHLGDTVMQLFAMLAREQCAQQREDYPAAIRIGRELVERANNEPFADRLEVYTSNLATALIMSGDTEESLVVAADSVRLESLVGTLYLVLDAFSMLAFNLGRVEEAARIIGYADEANKFRHNKRETVETEIRKRVMRLLGDRLGAGSLQRLMAEGARIKDDRTAALLALGADV